MLCRGLKVRWAAMCRAAVSLCAVCGILLLYASWIQPPLQPWHQPETSWTAPTHQHASLSRKVVCPYSSPPSSSSSSSSSFQPPPIDSKSPHLFFTSCQTNTGSLRHKPYHLVTSFNCTSTHPTMDTVIFTPTRFNNACPDPPLPPPLNASSQAPCLKQFIKERCYSDGLPVPRLVHYVWFSEHAMDFASFLSALAAYRFLRPCLILYHADSQPQGPYWRALLSLVPVVVLVQRSAPASIFGRPLGAVQHKSDIARLEILREYGGIYLDGDQIVVKSLDEFRVHEFVMGHENVHNLANSLLISVPNANFIDLWYRNYRSYNPRQWGIHSTFLPLALARIYPKMIHNAGYAFIKPDLPDIWRVWEGHYNWTQNHAMHLYYRSMLEWGKIRANYTLPELIARNTSLGEIARHVIFGSKDACWQGKL